MADEPPRRTRGRKTKFQRAADGSMTLMEHLADLRQRLLIAVIAILVGTAVAFYFADDLIQFLSDPYCSALNTGTVTESGDGAKCEAVLNSPISHITLMLKISLYSALVGTAPIWLYQLWAFIAPGLHRNERKYAYLFIGIAAPLFLAGAILAYFVVAHGMEFIMLLASQDFVILLNLEDYLNFFISVMMVFGIGFEFPLIMLMLNVIGLVNAKRMLGWWRIVVVVSFCFTAVFTPTPDPFGMTALAICMLVLYLAACGVAFLNDKRKGITYDDDGLDDEEASDIGTVDDESATSSVGASNLDDEDYPDENERRNRLGRRVDGYDDIT
ncbi:twin-arginine translocase subunit TatC [Glycomyces harbinensis]|uniref:Sec-independent protein translocase protein TatC n=1 Tax=Glycomyces harbinensis TaxID=58114 RepID=A0A1G6RYJ4_9ACTN|nr:twin-arginine translocase subunit TatC [Glycomyces harbinensis]SDD09016.1 sec-independent protein translocase protein TatC [Glycomyces harbinensis]